MGNRRPKVHLFREGGGMVTGTDDVAAAQRLIVDKWLAEQYGAPYGCPALRDAVHTFRRRQARVETGRIVPAGPDNFEGYAWFWRSGYAPGKPGVTTAVVWS